MKTLHIAPGLPLPLDIATSTVAIIAFSTYIGVLRRNGLVVVDRSSGLIRANDEVFS